MWDCRAPDVTELGEKVGGAEMGPENRDWVERQIEGSLGYTHVVTYVVKEERIQNSCRMRHESLGAVCIGCVVPP